MSTHTDILRLYLKLGYTKIEGVCYGMTIRWLEAHFLGEEHLFDARIQRIRRMIASKVDIVQRVNAAKAKKGKNLTKKDKQIFDLLAFFDSLELFHSPLEHSALFNQPHANTQQDITPISYFASSEKIRTHGGLIKIYSESMILTTDEIKKYLDDLGLVLQKSGSSKDIFGLLISGFDHTIALSYKPNIGWSFMDINQYPAQRFTVSTTKILAEKIADGFNFSTQAYTGPIALSASVITTKNCSSLQKATKALTQFATSHVITKEIASREHEGVGLAWIAASEGHASVVEKLAQQGADLNTKYNDLSLAYVATDGGHASVVAVLGTYGANLNEVLMGGRTLVHQAACRGFVSVLVELRKHGADFNKTTHYGHTPAHMAAEYDRSSVITELGTYGAKLNTGDLHDQTPAFTAAKKGYSSVLSELIKWGADLSIPARFSPDTLKFIIKDDDKQVHARMNHFINRQLSQGKQIISLTPYDIAVIKGHKGIIQLLSKQAIQTFVDKKETLNNNSKPLRKAPHYLVKLNALQIEQKELEAQIKNVEALIEIARKNDAQVVGKKYFIELMDGHKALYASVLNNTNGAAKEQMMKHEAKLRSSTVSSKLLPATGCRFFPSKAKHEYLPKTLNNKSKTHFKRLAQDALGNLKQSLADTHRKITDLHKQYKNQYGTIRPFLKTISQESLTELLNNIGNTKQPGTKPQEKSHSQNSLGNPGAPGLGLI